ncbi:hypothetical protein MRX96_015358 [Rhipicephalus microplus]
MTMCGRVFCGVVLVMFMALTMSRGCLENRRFYNFCQKQEMRCENNADCCEGCWRNHECLKNLVCALMGGWCMTLTMVRRMEVMVLPLAPSLGLDGCGRRGAPVRFKGFDQAYGRLASQRCFSGF